jgi:type I restriction enzyme S subunit
MSIRKSAHHAFPSRYGIPSGWTEVRLRDAAEIVGGGTPDSSDPRFWNGDIPWLTPTEMTSLRGRLATTSERKITGLAVGSSNCRLLPIGALVLSTRGTIGNIAIVGVPLTCNQSCEALLPREGVSNEYLYYLLVFLKPLLERFGAGTTFASVTRRDIRDIRFSLPVPLEQTVIAEILVAVDEALAAAQEKLATGSRFKRALMQRLFTQGLPGRHHRFQKTKWIEAPACWRFRQLRQIADVEAGFTMGRDLSGAKTVEVAYLTVVNVQEGGFDLSNVERVLVKTSELDGLLLRDGDVLMTEGGDRDKLGRGGLWREQIQPCVYQNHIFRIRMKSNDYRSELFHFLLQTWQAKNYFYAHAKQTSNLCTINSRELKRFPLFEPPHAEQEEMLSLMSAADSKLAAIESEISSLEGLKRSLMQNLLTGRVRVRI